MNQQEHDERMKVAQTKSLHHLLDLQEEMTRTAEARGLFIGPAVIAQLVQAYWIGAFIGDVARNGR